MKKRLKTLILDLLFITAGTAIYAVEVNAFTAPNHIAAGGITGISTMLNFLFGSPIGLVTFLINVPIIIWAIIEIGYKLVAKTIFAIVMMSFMIDLFSHFIPAYTGNMFIVSLVAGVLEGVGLSLVFLRGSTTGGSDMIARLLGRRMPHVSMGKLMLFVDGVIVLVSVFVYGSIENGVYACIVIFVSTKIIDNILYGADSGTGKMFLVMSPKVQEMGARIMEELDRGVTYLDSKGGYTKEPGETLLCAVRRFEVFHIQQIIREVDRNAFVIVGDAGEITGEGFRPVKSDDKPLREVLDEFRQRAQEHQEEKKTTR